MSSGREPVAVGVAYFFGVWVALCVGSFLNVVIYRLPIMMDRESRTIASEIMASSVPFTGTDDRWMRWRTRFTTCG